MLQSHPPAERLRIIRESGFDGVDCRLASLEDAEFLAALGDSGLPLASVYSQIRTPSLLDADANGRAQAVDDAVHRAIVSAEHGADNMILVPVFGKSRLSINAAAERLAQLETAMLIVAIKEIGERLADSGIRVVLEPLNSKETHFLTSPTVAAQICREAGSHSVRAMVDTYHCSEEGHDSRTEIERVSDQLALVHLSDSGRVLPGEGEVDFRAVCCCLEERGYAGWQGFECRQINTPNDERALTESVAMLRSIVCPA
jgi:sugar phosphate isomerase/epimerase